MGLEEEAVFSLLQRATNEHRIRSAFTRGSVRGSIYVESILDADIRAIHECESLVSCTGKLV